MTYYYYIPIQGMDKNAFLLPTAHMYIKDNPQDYVFKLKTRI